MTRRLLALASVLLLAACDGAGDGGQDTTAWEPIAFDPAQRPPDSLSEAGLLRWDPEAGRLEHHPDVVPYDLATPLYSDYASKERALWIPDGAAEFRAEGLLDLPVGTVLLKTFLFPADLRAPDEDVRVVETRLLVHTADGWEAWPYLWREDGSDADLRVSGAVLDVSVRDREGDERHASYLVPQRNQCLDCHEARDPDDPTENVMVPIGPTARNLNRDMDYGDGPTPQLRHLEGRGVLAGLPPLQEVDAAFGWRELARPAGEAAAQVAVMDDETLERAARDYLDVNCAHCHSPGGVEGVTSQLFLDHATTDPFSLGVCKPPGSAGKGSFGRDYDVVPGDPDASILLYRLETEDPGAMMPDIGRSLRHDQGVALLREWIRRMPGDCGD